MFTIGGKLLQAMKKAEMSILELARASGVSEHTILDIMADIQNPDIGVMCRLAEGLGVYLQEVYPDDKEQYSVTVQKNTLAKLLVVSEIQGMELEELVHIILEKGIEEHGFYN